MADPTEPTLTVDGKEYKINDLSKEAAAELTSMRVAEQEMLQLQAKIAIATTARNAYRQALIALLPKDTQ
ncbi:MAG: hypothetical protein COC20_07570 [Cellvibrionales bacterium]|nr:MAG: hypothetical protein COC20_07570 [Cellvibrionales bacterium]